MVIDPDDGKWLAEAFGRSVRFGEPMSRHTSLRVGGPAEAYVEPENREDLVTLVNWARDKGIPYMILGGGTNLLVRDGGIEGLVICLGKCLRGIAITATGAGTVSVTAMAGSRMQTLCDFAIDRGLEGMHFALGIPGTVGGAIMMNAGTSWGRVEDCLEGITVLGPDGKVARPKRERLTFEYRRLLLPDAEKNMAAGPSVVLDGCFGLHPSSSEELRRAAKQRLEERRRTQPLNLPSAGCFFKNPASGRTAGELIEQSGLKGKRMGGAEVSTKHANFLVNGGHATAADLLLLGRIVQETVFQSTGVHLETEVQIVGT